MATVQGRRGPLQQRTGSVWLYDPTEARWGQWLTGGALLGVVAVGIVLPLAPGWAGWLVFSLVALGMGLGTGLFLLFSAWSCRETVQWCGDCLQPMAGGAHVCPYCGFRETPRKEQP